MFNSFKVVGPEENLSQGEARNMGMYVCLCVCACMCVWGVLYLSVFQSVYLCPTALYFVFLSVCFIKQTQQGFYNDKKTLKSNKPQLIIRKTVKQQGYYFMAKNTVLSIFMMYSSAVLIATLLRTLIVCARSRKTSLIIGLL